MNSHAGHDHMGRSGWALTVRLVDDMQCSAGRVDTGSGTNPPYRSETCGLLAGMRVAWSSRIVGDITLTMDN